ncbi:MAG: glycosyltransferase family 2 protein [Pseudomonadota bacterium]
MTRNPVLLSGFIISKDEADRIVETIVSIRDFCDEIIVVDSGSTDDTVAVSKAAGARVVHQDFLGYGPQKRFAEDLCKHDWVLNVDADEPMTKEAQEEIAGLLQSGKVEDFDCWIIRRRDVYPHEDEPASWAYYHDQIRLYDRRKSRFAESTVHDSVIAGQGATVGRLKGVLGHRSHRDINFQVTKFNRYAEMQVADLIARGRRLPRWRLLTEFPLSFLKAYFIRRHFLYGFWGFSISISYAYSRFLRVAKFHEAELQGRVKSGR